MVLRLLDAARAEGWVIHFFASLRSLRSGQAAVEAVLNDGHALGFLCRDPASLVASFEEFEEALMPMGHVVDSAGLRSLDGLSYRPEGLSMASVLGSAKDAPDWIRPAGTTADQEAYEAGYDGFSWSAQVLAEMNSLVDATICVRPLVLMQLDPHLDQLRQLVSDAIHSDRRMTTLTS